VRIHDLRHFAATTMLDAGAHYPMSARSWATATRRLRRTSTLTLFAAGVQRRSPRSRKHCRAARRRRLQWQRLA
jgi:hypothetical protein